MAFRESDADLDDPCSWDPVHTIGQIQPHGVLFAISEPDLIVRQVSMNVADLLGMSPEFVLGHSFEAVLGAKQFETFASHLVGGDALTANPLRMRIGGSALRMDCLVHRQDGALMAELELLDGAYSLEPVNLETHVRGPLSRMELAADIAELAEACANEIRRLSGFDRVMIYRFDEAWNGKVIAEAMRPSPVSYLGLWFPAGDIPPQARRLFLLNRLRTIVDVAAAPAAIFPANSPLTGRALDLTYSCLRNAAPIHLEYLRNMGVQSTMIVSIVVAGQLWGLIACHHAAPRRLDCTTRTVCELIAKFLGSQVALRIDNAALQRRLTSRNLLHNHMAQIDAASSTAAADRFADPGLLELFGADGLLARVDGVETRRGLTVPDEILLPLVSKLQQLSSRGIASSDMLSALDSGVASGASQVSGALLLTLSEPALTGQSGDYLLFLRREFIETLAWAGNPDKSVTTDEQGRVHPRASFESWPQTRRGRSRPWGELELESARFLREQLLRLSETQRFLQAKNEARQAAEIESLAKSRFLANISHEIRTPMNGVAGMLQLLLLEDLTPAQQRYATVAQSSGKALLALIDDILDLSKIEAEKMVLENLAFNLRGTVEEVVRLSRALSHAKGLQIHSRISPEIPPLLLGDANRLRQVLTNLASNAVKFTEKGEVTLAADVEERRGEDETTIRFSVTDTGIGLRREQIVGLFFPFVQADSSLTRKYGGAGLGLAICKHIAGLMGGTIGVDSVEGKGSTFWFTAVFAAPHPSQRKAASEWAASGNPESTGIRADARIPVAEDNTANRELALAQLPRLGYDAGPVTNGAELIEALPRERYDLAPVDCEMPVMDGWAATTIIRVSTQADISTVALTADSTDPGQPVDALAKRPRSDETDQTSAPLSGEKPAPAIPNAPAAFIFHAEDLLRRLMGDRQLAGMVVQGFLNDAPSQLSGLRERLDAEDAHGFGLRAHKLSGASATVAAKALHAVAEAMELAGKAAQLDACRALLPRAVEEFQRYKSTLERTGWV
jgi:light-regulated signal transduction histidine kinase (bacteriophytochrome)/HPt (histidine-containing phosphotransfer) domain-containing protein